MSDCDRAMTATLEGAPRSDDLLAHAKSCPACERVLSLERHLEGQSVGVTLGPALREALDRDLAPVRSRAWWSRAWLPAAVSLGTLAGSLAVTARPSGGLLGAVLPALVLWAGAAAGFALVLRRGPVGLGPPPWTRWGYVAAAGVLLAVVSVAQPHARVAHPKDHHATPAQPLAGTAAEALGRMGRAPENTGEGALEGAKDCATLGSVLAALVAMSLFAVSRRTSPVSPRSAGAAVGVAAGLAGAAALQVHCPCDGLHVLVGHGLPVALGAAVGALTGRRMMAP